MLVPALVFAASPTVVAPPVCMPQTMLPPVIDQYGLIFRKAIVDTDRSKVVHRHEWNRRDTGIAADKSGETGNEAQPGSCLHDLLRKKARDSSETSPLSPTDCSASEQNLSPHQFHFVH
jgi:hypothetical protein